MYGPLSPKLTNNMGGSLSRKCWVGSHVGLPNKLYFRLDWDLMSSLLWNGLRTTSGWTRLWNGLRTTSGWTSTYIKWNWVKSIIVSSDLNQYSYLIDCEAKTHLVAVAPRTLGWRRIRFPKQTERQLSICFGWIRLRPPCPRRLAGNVLGLSPAPASLTWNFFSS